MKFSLLIINVNMTTIVGILTWLAGWIQQKTFLKQKRLFSVVKLLWAIEFFSSRFSSVAHENVFNLKAGLV